MVSHPLLLNTDCPHSHYGSIITNTIISLARHLGMNVVAEGVEREEQLEHLREKGAATRRKATCSGPLCRQMKRRAC
nr:EAL domain-containing protein [Geobacillus kaustophilus]